MLRNKTLNSVSDVCMYCMRMISVIYCFGCEGKELKGMWDLNERRAGLINLLSI